MDLEFTPEENAFRDEVRAFLAAHLPARLSAKVTQGFFQAMMRADAIQRALGPGYAPIRATFEPW